MHRITAPERRARLGLRHRLAPGSAAGSPAEVAESLVAVHSTDPSSVYLGILSRMADGSLSAVEHALYQDRTLIRLLGMRRTVFVTTLDVAAQERRKVVGWLTKSGVGADAGGPDHWLAEVEQVALQALAARGEATAA